MLCAAESESFGSSASAVHRRSCSERQTLVSVSQNSFGRQSVVPWVLFVVLPFSHLLAAVAILSHLAGTLIARWLFFAEAEHVVGLYYGKR